MRFHKLTLLASVFFTIAVFFVALLFGFAKQEFIDNENVFYLSVFLGILLIFIFNYGILDFLFSLYGKKQIRRISTILPEEIINEDNNNLNFKELGERVSELNLKNTTEIDTMKEMEIYRKEYIGNISHELKTPLFSIQGYVETLMEGGVEDLSVRDKYLERIDKSVERLLNIAKDLDMINQFESGRITLEMSKFDINNLIKEIIDLLDLKAQKKNSRVQLQTSANQIFVIADKQKISQVLINLISNAIHYANREMARITVRTNVLKNKVFVEVEDNGMGIKPEAIPRIFERFYRVESSRNRNDGGSGLGLPIVKHILEAHQENISVESTYLEGTKFSFLLEKSN